MGSAFGTDIRWLAPIAVAVTANPVAITASGSASKAAATRSKSRIGIGNNAMLSLSNIGEVVGFVFMDNSLVLRGQIILETGDGEQIVKIRLDDTAEEFFTENGLGDCEVWAEQFLEARFIGAVRSMVRAHIQRIRKAENGGRLDRPFSPYGKWNPPDHEATANMERILNESHDAFLDL